MAPPPSRFEPIDPAVERIPPGEVLLRIYSPEPYGTEATTFRGFGPLLRFDHHRPDASDAPREDPDRGVLYAASGFTCCVAERFGDEGAITLTGNRVARLRVIDELQLLDLRGLAATRVGTAPGIGAVGERRVTHGWARYLYAHPRLRRCKGLVYTSFHSGLDAVVLWERARKSIVCRPGEDWELADPAVSSDLQLAADALELWFAD